MSPFEQWRHILTTSYAFLAEEPERARFHSQLDESPYHEEAHARLAEAGDPIAEAAVRQELVELMVDLPPEAIYALSFGVAVRLIAAGAQLKDNEIDTLVTSTWRAVTKP